MLRSRFVASCLALTALVTVLLAGCTNSPPIKPPSTGGGQVINVSPSQDLGTVAKDAPSGSTLALADGTYTLTAPLLVDHDLTLTGGSGNKVTVRFDGVVTTSLGGTTVRKAALSYNPVLHVQGGTFTASGVTFEYTGSAQANVAVIENATVDIQGCTFIGGVTGADAGIGDGLDLYGSTTGTVKGSTFTGNDHAGVVESDTADVTVTNATASGNMFGALFYGRATGSLSGGSFSANSQNGIYLTSSVGDAGGPSPTIDGATVQNNGASGILYTVGSAGAFTNGTVSGNAEKGVWLLHAAHPTLDGNDIFGNTGDGVAYENDGAGTLSNNHIHDNGDKGLRVLGTAHPDVTTNQVSGNVGEGVAYIGSAAGTLSGNTVTGNGSNGLSFIDQTAPSVSDNGSLDNGDCGLLLDGSAAPSFADNTVTGNGNDICDRRTLPTSPIANQCATGDNSLNPDPTRYLAVVVEDANGTPLPNVGVGLTMLGNTLSDIYPEYGRTDSTGVALLLDTTLQSWIPQGTYSGLLQSAASGAQPAIDTACGNVPFPGTVVLRPDDTSLTDVSVNVTSGGSSPVSLTGELGHPWGGLTVFDNGTAVQANGTARVLPGSYGLSLLAETASDASFVFQDLTVSGATTVDTDVTTLPTADAVFEVRDASGGTGTATVSLFRQAPDLWQTSSYSTTASTVHVTPGDYWAFAELQLPDPTTSGTYWDYFFRAAAEHFGPAGSSSQVLVGGSLTATVATDRPGYAAGDTVYITPHVEDGNGDKLQGVWTTTSALTLSAMTLTPVRHAVPRSGLAPMALSPGQFSVAVTDPNGSVVFNTTVQTDNLAGGASFQLGAGATAGTYTVDVQADIGPYQASTLQATTTFTVQ